MLRVQSHRRRLTIAVAALVAVAGVAGLAAARALAGRTSSDMASSTFEVLRFSNPPSVLDERSHRDGADYTLKFSHPFVLDQVTVPSGYEPLARGAYAYGNDTALGSFAGPAVGAEKATCDLNFVRRADSPPDRSVIVLEIGCGIRPD